MSPSIRKSSVLGLPVIERFVRSAGPRGQNADRDATAVELRVALDRRLLPPDVMSRLLEQNRNHVTRDGKLIIVARSSRSQLENRRAARARLVAIIDRAFSAGDLRVRSGATARGRETRLSAKHHRTNVKRTRSHELTLEDLG